MYLDGSVFVAVLGNLPERRNFLSIIQNVKCITSPVSVAAAATELVVLTGSCGSAVDEIATFLEISRIYSVPIDDEILRGFSLAWDRYGKYANGAAKLNVGDCFSYAIAKKHGVDVLCVGSKFTHTDLG